MKWPWGRVEEKTGASMVALSQLPGASWGRVDTAALTRDGYTGNAVVYRCIRMVAEAAASIPLVASEQVVQDLLDEPAPEQTGRLLLEQIYTDLQISGNAWAEAVTIAEGVRPRGIFNLPVSAVRVMQDGRGYVTGYAVRVARGERLISRDADGWSRVLHLKFYNPGDASYGFSPIAAARKALDLHNGSAEWAKALLDNAARPSGALIYGKNGAQLTDEQFDRLKAELGREHSGSGNAGRPLLLEGGLEWKPMSLSPAEMDFQDARNAAAREIALTFGVPPMLLGIPGDNTYSNYKEANTAFWRHTVLPLVLKTSESLAVWLSGRFDDARLVPDLDQVPAFMSERDALWKRIGDADFLSTDEKRQLLGLN
ncbi:MAG: phage portal protein [Henriciella sp.]|nr:phage portal protein [Henriciella sp.]